jgi:RHS repeat-associated protein
VVGPQHDWDNEGKLTGADNPAVPLWSGVRYQYFQFDNMGRASGTTTYNPNTYQWDTVATAAFGTAGQITSLWTAWAGTETRTYNSLLQLTRTQAPNLMDNLSERSRMQYVYTAGYNNGRVAETIDGISGEDVQYTYDSLQRLVLAETTGSGGWGDAYTYDGFGNLTAKTVTKGSAPAMTAVYDPATNWPVGGNYDANGNAPIGTWSVENRLLSQTLDGVAITWGYDGSGRRMMKYQVVNGQGKWTFYLYDIAGRRMAQFVCAPSGTYPYNTVCTAAGTHVYFAGKPIAATDATGRLLGVTDRLGSVRASETNGTWATASYYPYGEEKQPLAPDGMEKFGTYVRDSSLSGQDYAGQRYYSPNLGRFNSPDPGGQGSRPQSPLSWNRYAYVQGDPSNRGDPSGLDYHRCDWSDTEVSDGEKMPGDDGCEGPADDPYASDWYDDTPGPSEGICGGVDASGLTFFVLDPACAATPASSAAMANYWIVGPLLDTTTLPEIVTTLPEIATVPQAIKWVITVTGSLITAAVVGLLNPTATSGTDTLYFNPDYVEAHCVKVGQPRSEPSRTYPNSTSIEQDYICPDGNTYTVHTIKTNKSGTTQHRHVRRKPGAGGPYEVF